MYDTRNQRISFKWAFLPILISQIRRRIGNSWHDQEVDLFQSFVIVVLTKEFILLVQDRCRKEKKDVIRSDLP